MLVLPDRPRPRRRKSIAALQSITMTAIQLQAPLIVRTNLGEEHAVLRGAGDSLSLSRARRCRRNPGPHSRLESSARLEQAVKPFPFSLTILVWDALPDQHSFRASLAVEREVSAPDHKMGSVAAGICQEPLGVLAPAREPSDVSSPLFQLHEGGPLVVTVREVPL